MRVLDIQKLIKLACVSLSVTQSFSASSFLTFNILDRFFWVQKIWINGLFTVNLECHSADPHRHVFKCLPLQGFHSKATVMQHCSYSLAKSSPIGGWGLQPPERNCCCGEGCVKCLYILTHVWSVVYRHPTFICANSKKSFQKFHSL